MGRAPGRGALVVLLLAGSLTDSHALELRLSKSLAGSRPEGIDSRQPGTGTNRETGDTAPRLRPARELPGKAAAGGPVASRQFPEPTQPLIVALSINAVPRGEKFVHLTQGGGLLAKVEDLRGLITLPADLEAFTIDGEAHVLLAQVPGAKVAFDDKTLVVEVTMTPDRLPEQVFDLTRKAGPVDLVVTPRSALLNYRLGYFGASGAGQGQLSLATEGAVSFGSWLFTTRSTHTRSADQTESTRLESQFIRDDRDGLRRLIVGDDFTPGLALGSALPFGGITFAKAYQLDPYVTRQPSAGFRGMADFPSQVEFYVGNTLVMRQRIDPGPFEIRNFNYYGGRQDVRVVVRDIFGRERSVAYPFYFAPQGLAPGLHDYSYQFGALREEYGARSNAYGAAVFSAFHRYGFNDWLTLGLRAEGTSRQLNAGPEAVVRSERAGIFSASAAASRDRDRDSSGHAFLLTHAFQLREFTSQLAFQRHSERYAPVHTATAPVLPRSDLSAVLGYSTPRLGSFNVGYGRREMPGEPDSRAMTLSYSYPIAGLGNFLGTYRRELGDPGGFEIFVGVQFLLGGKFVVNASHTRDVHGVRTQSVQVSRELSRGEGVAYSVSAQRRESESGSDRSVNPRLEWNGRYGTVSGEAISVSGTGMEASTTYSVALAGAVVAAGGRVALSRPITDSFAIVQVTPPLAGVRVYENSQEVGRTDAGGSVLLPNIASYSQNYASINDKDIPIEYSIERLSRTFSPSYRSGSVVPFAVTRVQGFTGRMTFRRDGAVHPLEYHLVMLAEGGARMEIPTAGKGDFYAENLSAGRHRARVVIDGKPCEFDLVVPETAEALVSLDEVFTCSIAP